MAKVLFFYVKYVGFTGDVMTTTRTFRYIGGAILLALATAAYASVDAGRVEFVFGNSRALAPNGAERVLKKGDVVHEGDTVITGPSASLQLLMVDQAMLAVRPNSRLRIDTYRFKGKEDGSELGVLRLIKGTFRSITGLIGHTNKKNYRIITDTANIGVRGTDHEAGYLLPGQTEGAPGTYDKVNWGGTYIKTPWGSVDVSPNQVGFASSKPGSMPVLLQGIPGFLQATPPMSKDADASGSDQPERVAGQDADNPATVEQPTLNNDALSYLNHPSVVTTNLTPDDVSTNFSVAGVYGDISSGIARNGAFEANEVPFEQFMSNKAMALAASDPTSKLIYNRATVPTVEQGDYTWADGTVVNWGIYGTGSAVNGHTVKDQYTGGAGRKPDYMQIMGALGTPASVLNNLTATYQYVVASTPVISYNNTTTGISGYGGGVTSARIALAGGELTGYAFTANDGSANWTASCTSCSPAKPVSLSSFASGINIGGSSPTGSATGQANGQIVGTQGQGVISSFSLTDPSSGSAITGSFAASTTP